MVRVLFTLLFITQAIASGGGDSSLLSDSGTPSVTRRIGGSVTEHVEDPLVIKHYGKWFTSKQHPTQPECLQLGIACVAKKCPYYQLILKHGHLARASKHDPLQKLSSKTDGRRFKQRGEACFAGSCLYNEFYVPLHVPTAEEETFPDGVHVANLLSVPSASTTPARKKSTSSVSSTPASKRTTPRQTPAASRGGTPASKKTTRKPPTPKRTPNASPFTTPVSKRTPPPRMAVVEEDHDGHRCTLLSLQTTIDEQEERLALVNRELVARDDQIIVLQDKLRANEELLAAQEQTIRERTQRAEQLTKQIAALKQQLAAEDRAKRDATSRLQTLGKELDDLKARYDILTQTHAQQGRESTEELNELRATLRTTQAEIAEQQRQISNLTEREEQLKLSCHDLEEKNDNLEREAIILRDSISSAKQEQEQLQREYQAVTVDLQGKDDELRTLSVALQEEQQEKQALAEARDRLLKAESDLTEQLAAIRKKFSQQESTLTTAQDELRTKDEHLASMQHNLGEQQQLLSAQKRQLSESAQQQRDRQQEYDTLFAQHDAQTKQLAKLRQAHDTSLQELDELRTQHAAVRESLTTENANLQATIAQQEKELTRFKAFAQQQQDNTTEQEERLTTLTEQAQSTIEELQHLRERLTTITDENTTLKSDLTQQNLLVTQLREQLELAKQDNETIDAENTELRSQIKEITQQQQEQMTRLQSLLDGQLRQSSALFSSLAELDDALELSSSECAEIGQEHTKLVEAHATLATGITALTEQLQAKSAMVDKLNATIAALQEDKTSFDSESTQYAKKIAQLQKEATGYTITIRELEERCASLSSELLSSQNTFSSLSTSLDTEQEQREKITLKYADLQSALATERGQHTKLAQEHDTLQRLHTTAERTVADLRSAFHTTENQQKELAQALAAEQRRREEVTEEHAELQQSHAATEQTVVDLRTSLEEEQRQREELATTHAELQQSHAATEQTVVDLRTSLEEEQRQREELATTHAELQQSHAATEQTVVALLELISTEGAHIEGLAQAVENVQRDLTEQITDLKQEAENGQLDLAKQQELLSATKKKYRRILYALSAIAAGKIMSDYDCASLVRNIGTDWLEQLHTVITRTSDANSGTRYITSPTVPQTGSQTSLSTNLTKYDPSSIVPDGVQHTTGCHNCLVTYQPITPDQPVIVGLLPAPRISSQLLQQALCVSFGECPPDFNRDVLALLPGANSLNSVAIVLYSGDRGDTVSLLAPPGQPKIAGLIAPPAVPQQELEQFLCLYYGINTDSCTSHRDPFLALLPPIEIGTGQAAHCRDYASIFKCLMKPDNSEVCSVLVSGVCEPSFTTAEYCRDYVSVLQCMISPDDSEVCSMVASGDCTATLTMDSIVVLGGMNTANAYLTMANITGNVVELARGQSGIKQAVGVILKKTVAMGAGFVTTKTILYMLPPGYSLPIAGILQAYSLWTNCKGVTKHLGRMFGFGS